MANWNVRLTPKALGAKAATLEAERAKRRTFIVAGTIEGLSPKLTVHHGGRDAGVLMAVVEPQTSESFSRLSPL